MGKYLERLNEERINEVRLNEERIYEVRLNEERIKLQPE